MAITNQERVGKGLDLLKDGLVPFVERELKSQDAQGWLSIVRQSVHERYRRLLVPVDFSQWSAAAVALARRVAPDATLVLMHALELPFEGKLRYAGVGDGAVQAYREGARGEAAERLRTLAAQSGVPPAQLRLSMPAGADPWVLVAQEEQEHDCDLIVIGKHGANAIEELLLGSTTNTVIAETGADVLVCTRNEPVDAPRA